MCTFLDSIRQLSYGVLPCQRSELHSIALWILGINMDNHAITYVLLELVRCNGYLAHPFEKETPWAFTTRLFFVVRRVSAIDPGGEWFSYTRENTVLWAADYQERPVSDLFRHELSVGWTSSTSWTLAFVVPLQAAQR